jgi:hypothetical protein
MRSIGAEVGNDVSAIMASAPEGWLIAIDRPPCNFQCRAAYRQAAAAVSPRQCSNSGGAGVSGTPPHPGLDVSNIPQPHCCKCVMPEEICAQIASTIYVRSAGCKPAIASDANIGLNCVTWVRSVRASKINSMQSGDMITLWLWRPRSKLRNAVAHHLPVVHHAGCSRTCSWGTGRGSAASFT